MRTCGGKLIESQNASSIFVGYIHTHIILEYLIYLLGYIGNFPNSRISNVAVKFLVGNGKKNINEIYLIPESQKRLKNS